MAGNVSYGLKGVVNSQRERESRRSEYIREQELSVEERKSKRKIERNELLREARIKRSSVREERGPEERAYCLVERKEGHRSLAL